MKRLSSYALLMKTPVTLHIQHMIQYWCQASAIKYSRDQPIVWKVYTASSEVELWLPLQMTVYLNIIHNL